MLRLHPNLAHIVRDRAVGNPPDPNIHPKTRITRLQIGSRQLVGWRVQFSLHRNKVVRVFSDNIYGSDVAARQAAETFANEESVYCQEVLSLMRRLSVRTNSRSGIPGVTRIEPPAGNPYWVAYWDENGRKRQKKFLINRYGEDDAKALAINARRQGVRPYSRRLNELKSALKLS